MTTAVQTYTVESVEGNVDKPDRGNGPMRSIYLNLAGVGKVEWYTRGTTQPPSPGSQLTGTVEDSQYGKKFKKAQQGGGGGGPRPEDPKRAARILRQHSQQMSIETLALAQALGIKSAFEGVEKVSDLVARVKQIADVYDKDAEEAAG